MTNVRAGVAYVDVKLGNIDSFKAKLKSEIESAAAAVGKRVGDKLASSAKPGFERAGKTSAAAMSKAFFKDASQSFTGGLRALSQGQFKVFGRLMQQAGVAGALGLRTGLEGGLRSIGNGIKNIVSKATEGAVTAFKALGNAGVNALKAIPDKMRELSTHLDAFSKRVGFASFQMQSFGFIAATAFTAPVAAALGFATVIGIKTASAIENATASLKFLLPAGYNVDALLKRLQKTAQDSPIFDTADLITYTQRFVAAGVSIQKTERFLKAFSNVALVTGVDSQRAGLAILAIAQAFGKGKLQAEELTQQLGEAMPAAMKLLRDGLGVSQKKLLEMVKSGKISGDDLIRIFTQIGESGKFLKGAAAGAETLSGKWQQFTESVQTKLGEIFLRNADKIKAGIDKLGPTLDRLITLAEPVFPKLVEGFDKFIKKIGDVLDWYNKLTPENKNLVKNIGLIALTVGPAVIALGTFMGAIAGIASGIALISNPVGAIVIGVGLAIIGIAAFIKWLKKLYKENSGFKKAWDENWARLMDIVKPIIAEFKKSWGEVKVAFDQLKKTWAENKDELKPLGEILLWIAKFVFGILLIQVGLMIGVIKGLASAIGPVAKAISSFFSGIAKILAGVIDFIAGGFTNDWKRVWKGIQEIWDGLWDAVVGTIWNALNAIWRFVSGFVTGVIQFFKTLYDVLVGHSIIPDMVNAIVAWFGKLVNSGRSLFATLGNFFGSFYGNYIAPFINAVKGGVNTVISIIAGIPGRIRSAIGNLGSLLYSAGLDVIQGLINGIRDRGSNIGGVIGGVVGSAVAAAKATLDSHSPSRVFMKIGSDVISGFLIGIRAAAPDVPKTMNVVMNTVIPKVDSPYFGSPASPAIDPRGGPKAALNIENYYAPENSDPRRQSEDWYFMITSRGGVA